MGLQHISGFQSGSDVALNEMLNQNNKDVSTKPRVTDSDIAKTLAKTPESILPEATTVEMDVPEPALEAAANSFNSILDEISSRGISFIQDEGSGRTIIQVIDKQSGDVLRQVPPQEYLEMVHKLNKAAEIILKDMPRFI